MKIKIKRVKMSLNDGKNNNYIKIMKKRYREIKSKERKLN